VIKLQGFGFVSFFFLMLQSRKALELKPLIFSVQGLRCHTGQ